MSGEEEKIKIAGWIFASVGLLLLINMTFITRAFIINCKAKSRRKALEKKKNKEAIKKRKAG